MSKPKVEPLSESDIVSISVSITSGLHAQSESLRLGRGLLERLIATIREREAQLAELQKRARALCNCAEVPWACEPAIKALRELLPGGGE